MPVKIKDNALVSLLEALPKESYANYFKSTQAGVAESIHVQLQASPIKGLTTVTKKDTKSQKQSVLVDDETDINPGIITNKKTGLSLSFKGSRTINLGDYNSATVAVMLTAPCEPEELEATYEWATDWVSKKIEEAIKDATGL